MRPHPPTGGGGPHLMGRARTQILRAVDSCARVLSAGRGLFAEHARLRGGRRSIPRFPAWSCSSVGRDEWRARRPRSASGLTGLPWQKGLRVYEGWFGGVGPDLHPSFPTLMMPETNFTAHPMDGRQRIAQMILEERILPREFRVLLYGCLYLYFLSGQSFHDAKRGFAGDSEDSSVSSALRFAAHLGFGYLVAGGPLFS